MESNRRVDVVFLVGPQLRMEKPPGGLPGGFHVTQACSGLIF
jgi:hypothetical protein